MKCVLIAVGLFVFCLSARAQQNYDVSLIDKSLLPYASAVVRDEQVSVDVKDIDNAVYHIKRVVTVLNKNGDDMARIVVWHNKSHVIKSIKGIVYDQFGKPEGKFSESDFKDVYAGEDFSLFEDSRVEYYLPANTDYPYTVECEYEVKQKETLNIPGWEPSSEAGMAVEKSSYTFTCKPGFNIRYKEINLPSGVITGTNKESLKTYTWQINNLKAVKYEPYSPNADKYLPMVKIAPEKFSYDGIEGQFTNWNDLGKWIYDKLLVNRQDVSQATAEYVLQLTKDISDPKLKAKKIYEYMQGRTHYVSVQIGIGGYQPFSAADVDRLNYGDCKALVNYTRALLKTVGIESYYCVVMADPGRKISLIPDFASMDQANHIILCVPFKNDTTWSDCTSQTLPFGYLGDFTDDRTVLACTPEGGKLMHTTRYNAQDNTRDRKAIFIINTDGGLSGNMTTTFKGTEYDDRERVISESVVEQKKYLAHHYADINNLTIEKLEFKQDKSMQPVTTENIQLKALEFASVDGDKINFMPNSTARWGGAPKRVRNRTTDVYINDGYNYVDEIAYTIPPGYKLDDTALMVNIKKPFGNFSASVSVNGTQLVYKRRLQVFDGTYPKDTYPDVVDFFQAVVDADGYTAALVKAN